MTLVTETVDDTVDNVETLLGDPHDPDNPLSYTAVLAADERGELLAEGERILDGYGLNAEFVPRALGGRLRQVDVMGQVLRAVFRRDPTLALGYGVTNYIAAAPVWAAGDGDQRRWMADLLLAHRKASAGYNELAHGNDFTRTELRAVPRDGRLFLNGRKELVNNVARADAVVLFARTDERPGNRSHAHLLVDMTSIPAERRAYLPRFRTVGMRGCLLGGVEFRDCPVPRSALIGEPGEGMETVLRAFQTTRGVLPSMAIGGLDTQLRLAARFCGERILYGRSVDELPHARSILTKAFLDLLICDALTTAVARALHLLPGQTSLYTAAVKYLVPKMLHEASYELATLLGARSYLREGRYGLFQKHARDVAVVTFGHANATVCLATMIPQLVRLAGPGRADADQPPAELFRPGAPLPDLDFDRLELTVRGGDPLAAVLAEARPDAAGEPADLCAVLAAELRRIRERCAALRGRDRTVIAGRPGFVLADRYATVLAAAACLGFWRQGALGTGPEQITGVLWRLAERLGRAPGPLPAGPARAVHAGLLARVDEDRALDLAGPPLAGSR